MRHDALRRIPSSAGRNSKGGFWVQWLTPIRKVTGTRACQESGGQVQVSEMMRRGTRVIWRKLDCLISQSPDDAKSHPSERYLKPAPWAPVSGIFPTDGSLHRLEIGISGNPAFAISRGSRGASSLTPKPDRRFPGMLLST